MTWQNYQCTLERKMNIVWSAHCRRHNIKLYRMFKYILKSIITIVCCPFRKVDWYQKEKKMRQADYQFQESSHSKEPMFSNLTLLFLSEVRKKYVIAGSLFISRSQVNFHCDQDFNLHVCLKYSDWQKCSLHYKRSIENNFSFTVKW